MKDWIRFPKSSGECSRQAHADFPAGAPYEREVSRDGFYGPATHIHHRHAPTDWSHWQGSCRPRAYDLSRWPQHQNSLWQVQPILHNADCQLQFWTLTSSMQHLLRNADGDQLLFVHKGDGQLFCDYGELTFSEGDYLLIPRGTLWRISCKNEISLFTIEATDQRFALPDKGIVGQHAIFDCNAIITAEINQCFLAQQDEESWSVEVKHNQQISTIRYPFNPLDAIGWHGDVCALKINWRDIRPLMSHRYHLPPSAHSTFVADNFVVCTFVPRPFESDPGALKVPFYHSNEDYDEIIFYHQGEFFSRDHIYPGMLSFHPRGFTHGPHPKAYKNSFSQQHQQTNEVAVMIDTRKSMMAISEEEGLPNNIEWKGYVDSWKSHEK
ncbi:homogentisate 1,2-dioxygenase [Gammaproteobacteria bacterium 42_54_T18]|nr:homogentisate 1,2-dioxygenase [Gammaproteobacteria bacterium 42_54_T18]